MKIIHTLRSIFRVMIVILASLFMCHNAMGMQQPEKHHYKATFNQYSQKNINKCIVKYVDIFSKLVVVACFAGIIIYYVFPYAQQGLTRQEALDIVSCNAYGLPDAYAQQMDSLEHTQLVKIFNALDSTDIQAPESLIKFGDESLFSQRIEVVDGVIKPVNGTWITRFNQFGNGTLTILRELGISPDSPQAQAAMAFCKQLIGYPE